MRTLSLALLAFLASASPPAIADANSASATVSSTVFIARKSRDGRALRALERPGLWNGAMAGWNTLFVEVPLSTFAPVKTVLDLLRPEHQSS